MGATESDTLWEMGSKLIPSQTGNGIKINSSPNRKANQNKFQPKKEMESKLIPAQTGNGTKKIYTNPKPFLSVNS